MKKFLVILLLLFPVHGAWADYDIDVNPGGKFKEGIFRGDPYVSGCIRRTGFSAKTKDFRSLKDAR